MKRISDKIREIARLLEELETISPASLDEYRSSFEKKAACERYAERIVEAATDLAFLAIKYKKLRMPEDDTDAFNILSEAKIISDDDAVKLKRAKGMRNIIAHEYGIIDDEIVFEAVTEELREDISAFTSKIGRILR